jgi:hypothetical protein
MNWTRRDWITLTSITALAPRAWAIGEGWQAPKAEDMAAKLTLDNLVIGIEAFDTAEKTLKPFGKADPNRYEILPVLVVIQNNRKGAIRVAPLEVQYVVPGLGKVEALRGEELLSAAGGPSKPNLGPRPLPIPTRKKKNPMAAQEFETRAFAARMIAAGESAHGFFYFNIRHRTSAKLYLNGFVDVTTNKEIFYFDIPFEA